jgi:hypothetical protein
MKALVTALLLLAMASLLTARPGALTAAVAPWAETALMKEADYIVNCSFTEYTKNKRQVQTTDDAYGAFNVVRIYQRGPDWVNPGEAAMGAIGLMAAAIQLKAAGHDVSRYDQVLDRFFRTWLLERQQPLDTQEASADRGGFFDRVYYDTTGKRRNQGAAKTGVTGQMISAMWKFYEYHLAVGSTERANGWLQQSWPTARLGGDFIRRSYNASYQLVRANSSGADLWISDSAYSAMGLRCLDRWAEDLGQEKSFDYTAMADEITAGLNRLKDNSRKKGFFRYRDSSRRYVPTYGDRIDQLCFLPYEADVLDASEPFARAISDWWTNGSDGIRMTARPADPNDWRYYGTHWKYFFSLPSTRKYRKAENSRVYPGVGLQLAKVEWKHARKTGDAAALNRARRRFHWARSTRHSNLWLGANGVIEANVPNGLVDWRDAINYKKKAENWARFVDTSAYFIEALLMLEYRVDTRYVPDRMPSASR